MVARSIKVGRRDSRRHAYAGVAMTAIAAILTSCSALDPEEESLVAKGFSAQHLPPQQAASTGWREMPAAQTEFRRVTGAPLQLVRHGGPDWVDDMPEPALPKPGVLSDSAQPGGPSDVPARLDHTQLAELRTAGEPMRLDGSGRPDWLVAPPEDPAVTEWAVGMPLRLVDLDRPDWLAAWHDETVVAEQPIDPSFPLVLSNGSYYWPEPAGSTEMAKTDCLPAVDAGPSTLDCPARDDQIALADTAVDAAALSELRGGFVAVGGFQIDFGYYVETLVDGVLQLTTVLTLDDMLAGQTAGAPLVGSIAIGGSGDTSTVIQHNLSAAEISATIANTQSNIDISTMATLAIEVIDLRHAQTGLPTGAARPMPLELQQSVIRGALR